MRLTEKHQIHKKHKLYSICDELCFNSKNLYNAALYEFRQSYIDKNRKELSKKLFKHANIVDLKGGHLLPMESPKEITKIIINYF